MVELAIVDSVEVWLMVVGGGVVDGAVVATDIVGSNVEEEEMAITEEDVLVVGGISGSKIEGIELEDESTDGETTSEDVKLEDGNSGVIGEFVEDNNETESDVDDWVELDELEEIAAGPDKRLDELAVVLVDTAVDEMEGLEEAITRLDNSMLVAVEDNTSMLEKLLDELKISIDELEDPLDRLDVTLATTFIDRELLMLEKDVPEDDVPELCETFDEDEDDIEEETGGAPGILSGPGVYRVWS
ncbi:uncharacterized protein RSE6_12025 [Rhynchosporium secalis]|uniref:Uncharacterized protein n=1 Tax=Rhynchosporium secalis TaxID=38038 RepID=A0A1E1MPB6_RHYSE|nr:uncharacterized protein RSE6_12025 [Rhynchosporium secalis]